MSQYCNLSPTDQLKVDRKLAELQTNTGQSWHCEITQLPKGHKRTLLLEVSVDGRIARPIPLKEDDTNPGGEHLRRTRKTLRKTTAQPDVDHTLISTCRNPRTASTRP